MVVMDTVVLFLVLLLVPQLWFFERGRGSASTSCYSIDSCFDCVNTERCFWCDTSETCEVLLESHNDDESGTGVNPYLTRAPTEQPECHDGAVITTENECCALIFSYDCQICVEQSQCEYCSVSDQRRNNGTNEKWSCSGIGYWNESNCEGSLHRNQCDSTHTRSALNRLLNVWSTVDRAVIALAVWASFVIFWLSIHRCLHRHIIIPGIIAMREGYKYQGAGIRGGTHSDDIDDAVIAAQPSQCVLLLNGLCLFCLVAALLPAAPVCYLCHSLFYGLIQQSRGFSRAMNHALYRKMVFLLGCVTLSLLLTALLLTVVHNLIVNLLGLLTCVVWSFVLAKFVSPRLSSLRMMALNNTSDESGSRNGGSSMNTRRRGISKPGTLKWEGQLSSKRQSNSKNDSSSTSDGRRGSNNANSSGSSTTTAALISPLNGGSHAAGIANSAAVSNHHPSSVNGSPLDGQHSMYSRKQSGYYDYQQSEQRSLMMKQRRVKRMRKKKKQLSLSARCCGVYVIYYVLGSPLVFIVFSVLPILIMGADLNEVLFSSWTRLCGPSMVTEEELD